MAQVVQTVYEAVVDQYLRGIEQLRASVRGLSQEEAKQAKETERSAVTEQQAARRRMEALKQEQATLRQLEQQRKRAFTVSEIEQFNRRIEQTKRNIATLRGEMSGMGSVANMLKGAFVGFAGTLAAALSVQSIMQFGRAAVESFAEAERAVNRLGFAIVTIGKEGTQQFERLVAQAQRMQAVTIFSDEQVMQAQAALSAYGLTAVQIEQLIPRAADLATILGTDLQSAIQLIGSGMQGMGRELKKLGIDVSSANTEMENLNIIMQGLANYTGAAASELDTVGGKMQQMRNIADDLKEVIGQRLAGAFTRVSSKITELVANLILGQREMERMRIGREVEAQIKERIAVMERENETIDKQIAAINDLIHAQEQLIEQRLARMGRRAREDSEQLPEIVAARTTIRLLKERVQQLQEMEQLRARELKADELRQLSLEELNRLLRENQRLTDIVSQSNVKAIERELKARRELAEQQERSRQKLLQEEQKLLQQEMELKISLAATEEERLLLRQQRELEAMKKKEKDVRSMAEIERSIAEITERLTTQIREKHSRERHQLWEKELDSRFKAFSDTLQKEIDLLDKRQQEEMRIRKETLRRLLEQARESGDVEAFHKTLNELFALEKQAINRSVSANSEAAQKKRDILDAFYLQEAARINESVMLDEGSKQRRLSLLDDFYMEQLNRIQSAVISHEDAENQIWRLTKWYNEQKQQLEDDLLQKRLHTLEEWKQASAMALEFISGIFTTMHEQKIEQLQMEVEAIRDAYDKEVEMLKQQLAAKQISQEQYQASLEEINQRRAQSEKDVQRRVAIENRRQAQFIRALRLFEMFINLSAAIAKVTAQLGIFAKAGIALVTGIILSQVARVKALPLPEFARGTRRKPQEGLAVVGEKGPEVVFLPQDTMVLPADKHQKYRQALQAMFDDRFDDFIQKAYVLPAMLKLRQERTATQQKVVMDEYTMIRALWQGTFVKNADEIGRAVARNLPKTDYRMR